MKTLLTIVFLLLAGGATASEENRQPAVKSADGIPIHAELTGDTGPTLVFVHGWSCDSTYWSGQIAGLAEDYRLVTVDLAGHGRSGAGRPVYTMEAFGQDVVAVLEAWDLTDVILVGHSMGGAVITEATLAAPGRVRGLIGVDNFQRVDMKMGEQQIAGFVAMFERDFAAFVPQWVSRMFPAGADSALVADIAGDMAAAPEEVALSAMENLLAWYGGQAPGRLAELEVPLMGLNSDMQATDEAAMRKIVPSYQVRYLPGTGHFLFREKPDVFNSLLRETIAAFD